MKKYKEYIKRLCALLLVCTLVVSQDLMPVHALTDNTTVTESTENEINATAGENTEATNGGQIEAQTPENSAVEAGNEKGGTVGEEIKENAEQADNGANLPENNAESTTPSGDDENQVDTAEDPAEEEINQDDKLLPEETTEDEIMPADAGTTENQYPEGSIHVNPSNTKKTDPLGNTVTVNPGDNKTGNGSLEKPYYSLGKAYEEVAVPSEGEPTEKNIYVHSGVIVSGEEGGTDENGTDIVVSKGTVKSATYFAEDRKLVVNQADDLDALFTVIGGTLTFQNMTVKMMDAVLEKGAELRIALSGGTAVLGNGLNVPKDKFYFRVNETVGGTKEETPDVAPIQVQQVPNTDGDKIPVVVSSDLVGKYLKTDGPQGDAGTKTTTQEWTVKIPIAQIANGVDPLKVVLKGIGSMGMMTYGAFTDASLDGTQTAETDQLITTEWNTPLKFTQQDNVVYLTGYHKTVTQEKVAANSYQGLIYVGKDSKGQEGLDTNDGLTIDTPVKTLNKAKELLGHYDALYKKDYNYPKIYINIGLNITDDQSLDFKEYETTENAEFAPSKTGYRASLWYGDLYSQYYSVRGVIHVGNGGSLYLGQGVNIRDFDIGNFAKKPDTLKDKKPEDVTGAKITSNNNFIRCESGCNIILENMKYESENGVLIYSNNTRSATSVTIKDCNITAWNLLNQYRSSYDGTLELQIEGASAVNCESDVIGLTNRAYSSTTEESVKIALNDGATWNAETKQPEGNGYLYSKSGAIIKYTGYTGSGTRKADVQIDSGLLAGNGTALMDLASGANQMSLYMKGGSKYYQANAEGSIIRISDSDQSQIYYQGGEIQSQGKAFLNTVKEGGLDYRLILDGGLPVTQDNNPLKILAEKQWVMPHIYLGARKTEAYQKAEYASHIEMDLYNAERTSAFSDMSKLVGKMDPADNLETIRSMFKLLYDGETEIYDGKAIITSQGGTYLILGVNGIYIDGTKYNAETGFGGRSYGAIIDNTHADGSMVNPVRTFWDAQLVYDNMRPEAREKLKGIYILNCVTIENGDKITVAGTGGAVSNVTGSQSIPGTYTCNFGDLKIYDSTNSPASNVYGSTMLYVQKGSLTLDHAVLDGSLISEDDKARRTMISVYQSGTLNISNTMIQNMNYAVNDGAIYVNDGTLKVVDKSRINDTNSRRAIYCIGNNTTCEIEDSEIISTGGYKEYNKDSVIYNSSRGTFILKGSSVLSKNNKYGLICEAYAACKIIDSQVESKSGEAAIYVSNFERYGNYPGGYMDISGSKTKITGRSAIKYYDNDYMYRYRFDTWSLKISGMPELESTGRDTLAFDCSNARLEVNITGAKIMSSGDGNGIYYAGRGKSITDQIILNASKGDYIEITTKDQTFPLDAVKVDTSSYSRELIVGLGGDVRTSIIRGEDFDFGNSNAKIVLKNELTGNPTYLVRTLEQYIGKTLVDCSGVTSKAEGNQSHFTLCEESVELYSSLGILLHQSGSKYNPAVKDEEHLWIPVSETIFWDWQNGDDNNAEKENGGHCPALAVKSVNGIRSVLLKDGKLKVVENELKVADKYTTPVKVAAMSTMYFYDNNADKLVDPKCYGDDFSNGVYKTSNAENTANVFNWVMPQPTNREKYLIDIVKVKYDNQLGNIFELSHSQEITFKMENVRFSGIKMMSNYSKAYPNRISIGRNVQLVMNNCYVDCSNDTYDSRYSYEVIKINNSGRNSQISNVTIKGMTYYGITVTENNKGGLLLDQVKIPDGNYALSLSGSAATATIRGKESFLRVCQVSNGGHLIAEEGTIVGYQSPAVTVNEGEFYLKGTAKVESKGYNGVNIGSGGRAYLEGGEIIGDTSVSQYDFGICNYGTTELSGTTIKKCGIGAKLVSGNITMTGGMITDNNYGVSGNMYTATMVLSGGSVSGNKYAGIIDGQGWSSNNRITFIMNGGEICNNGMLEKTIDNNYGEYCGGIVGCKDVTITGGRISGNQGYYGGGIVNCIGTVQISGGVIEENEGATAGGGIYQRTGTVRVEGGTIRNNRAPYGSAVLVGDTNSGSALLELNGGEITGNKNTDTTKDTGEIYIGSSQDMKIGKKGLAYPKVGDTIYLANKDRKIELTAAVRGDYNVRVYENSSNGFKKGDSIVIPNGDSVQSAASYLTHFTLLSDSYVLARKGKNLVLDGILFVNGTTNTNGDGALPNNPRNDFETVIEDTSYNDNVIYITGAVHIRSGENVVVNDRTIRRYTGQPLNGNKYDANIYNEPLFIVDEGATLTLINCTVSGRMGAKSDETYSQDTGYLIENYGTLNIDVDSSGSGIAAGVEKQTHSVLADNLTGGLGIAQHGTLNISPFSQIDQMVKLGGQNVEDTAVYYGKCASSHSLTQQKSCKDRTDRFINIYGDTAGTGLQKKLNLDVDNKVDGRLVTSYTALDKSASLQTEKTQHQIKDLKASGLYLTSRIPSTVTRAAATQTVDMILKRPGIYYVDGTKGNDANKGTCPDEALKTLEKAYEKLADDATNPDITSRGGIIYIVANVDLADTITIKEDGDASVMTVGSNTYNTQGDVIIRRYSKPTIEKAGYTTRTNTGTMFTIPDTANISIQGVTIDGHSQKLDSTDDTLAAEGVANADAIFSVNGKLTLGSGEAVTKNTLVQNNDASGKNGGLIRVERTGNLYLTGDMPKEADPEEGQAAVYGTRLSGGKAAKGNAVYADLGGTTEMKLAHGAKADYPEINGSIYLTGNKTTVTTEADKYSSFVTIADGTAGAITDNRYEFEVQDAYDGRLVVSYPDGTTLTSNDVKGYTVSGRQGYDVAVNDAAKSQIILKALGAVYIDGVSGVDTNDGTAPTKSVKTLKRAYELLKAKKGGVLYVVNTVTITDAQELTETSYKNYGTTVALTEGTVQIQRYGKPTAYGSSDWIESDTADYFNVESNANALFSVSGSGMLDLKNIQMDGHKDAVALTDSLAYKTNAGAIKATAPLIQVNGGKLNLGEGAVLQNNKNTTAPGSTTSTTGNVPGGAVYNSGTMNITGGVVKGNECKGTARRYTTSEAAETVTVTPDASGIWQAGKMNVNVSDTAKLNWDVDQYIYLAEQSYDSKVTEQADKDAKVSFLNVQALPTEQVLPLDLNRDGASTGSGSTGSVAGWFAPGRKVVEMSTEGMVTADNFKVNGDSYVGSWLEGTGTLTEKLILAERQDTTTILELQRGAKDCIVDVIVPIKAEANSTKEINNLSKKDITVSGAGKDTTIPARNKASVTINGTLSDENRIKISCSDGK